MLDQDVWLTVPAIRPGTTAEIPDDVLGDPALSLMAKGLYALVLAHGDQPVNPFEDTYEEPAAIYAAIGELLAHGLVIRVTP